MERPSGGPCYNTHWYHVIGQPSPHDCPVERGPGHRLVWQSIKGSMITPKKESQATNLQTAAGGQGLPFWSNPSQGSQTVDYQKAQARLRDTLPHQVCKFCAPGLQCLYKLKVSPYKIFNYQEKKSNFSVEKPGRCHLKQVTKDNITINRTN